MNNGKPARCNDFIKAVRAKGQQYLETADEEAEDPDISDMYVQNARWYLAFANLMEDGLWTEVELLFRQGAELSRIEMKGMPAACEMFDFIASFKEVQAA